MYATITMESLPIVEIDVDDILVHVDEEMKMEKDNEDFSSYLKAQMNKKKVTITSLSEMTGYSSDLILKSLYNYRNMPNEKAHIRYVLSICIAMRLDRIETENLLKRAGFSINHQNEDQWYRFVENFLYESSHRMESDLIKANYILVISGMEPLLPYYAMRYIYWDVFYDVETNEII